jgi:hypothetical protein
LQFVSLNILRDAPICVLKSYRDRLVLSKTLIFSLTYVSQFSASYGDKARAAKDGALDKPASKLLLKLCQKYDDVNSIDKLAATFAKVQSVKLVMQDNVDLALQNCVKLESIERAAEDLQQQAGFFKRDAKELRKRMWWKNCKVREEFCRVYQISFLRIPLQYYCFSFPKYLMLSPCEVSNHLLIYFWFI